MYPALHVHVVPLMDPLSHVGAGVGTGVGGTGVGAGVGDGVGAGVAVQAVPDSSYPALHDAHLASPFVSQSVPVAPLPLLQVHTLSLHSLFDEMVGDAVSYVPAAHTE